ncbi:MAG: hypothetical protein JKZ00_01165 [Flavobacteriaceae bacterium]|nr:hypothetical protein [Flavobacteriaceae bacterium]
MKFNKHKIIGLLCTVLFISSIQAQKYDKKYSEKFKVNKDVQLVINANNADINVSTWNKNEVSVEAVITVEGLSKKDAKKFLKNWEFEALGNKSKVEINANANKFMHFGDFNFDFDFGDFEMPEINFEMPEIDIDFDEIFSGIEVDFDEIFSEIEDYDFEEGEDKIFTFQSKGKKKTVVIKSKKDWKKFKKSPEYKEMMADVRKKIKEVKVKFGKIDKKKIKDQIKKAKIKFEKIDKVKIKAALAKAKVSIEKMKLKMANNYNEGNYVFVIEDGKSKKKVKITRKITIKVPKNATFILNTRHSKVKLPKGKVSGKVSYGTFKADEIHGGDLKIYFAPVHVNALSSSTVSLNNITDAILASVSNSKLISNSSGLKIAQIDQNVDLSSKFGELTIESIAADVKNFKLNLNFSDATIKLGKSKINFKKHSKNGQITLNGNFDFIEGPLKIKGKQSKLTIRQ